MSVGPNVVLVTIDTLRPDHLGCYGHDVPTSPRIDALAQQGVLFKQAITNGSYTLSAFPAILSSTYASMYGGTRSRLAPERPLLAELLRREGYCTAGFTSNPLVGRANGYDRGFDTFRELTPDRHQPAWHRIKGVQPLLQQPAVQRALRLVHIEGRPLPVYVSGDEVTDEACRWLDQVNGRFFLWVHYMDTHWPYDPLRHCSSPREIALAWTDVLEMHRAYRQRHYPGDQQMQRVIGLYDQAIQFADEQVGRLVDKLVKLGIDEQTLVALTSDHGEAFFEHGRFMHGAYYDRYDEILKVPLILRMPQAKRTGQSIARQVRLLDLAPTILDWLGGSQPREMEGVSLLPFIQRDADHDQSEYCVSEMWDFKEAWPEPSHCVAIRTERYKYIHDSRKPHTCELYALAEDAGETRNLGQMKPEITEHFRGMLHDHLTRARAASAHPLTEEQEITRRLRGLGYID